MRVGKIAKKGITVPSLNLSDEELDRLHERIWDGINSKKSLWEISRSLGLSHTAVRDHMRSKAWKSFVENTKAEIERQKWAELEKKKRDEELRKEQERQEKLDFAKSKILGFSTEDKNTRKYK